MKTLLINAPLEKRGTYKSFSPPLGLLYIAAVLEKNGFDVDVIDGNQERNFPEEVSLRTNGYNPHIVGISAMTPTFSNAVKTAEEIKRMKPESIVVMGGYHPTFNAERILRKYPFVDIIVSGEGEYALLEIVKGENLKNILGIAYRDNGEIRVNENRPQIDDLDELPFPARHLVKKYNYEYAGGFSWNDPRRYRLSELKRYTAIATSRGCPFRRIFCANTTFSGNRFRARSAENVVSEIEQMVREGSDRFFFVDDNFTASPERAIKISKYIRLINKNIKWFCMGRVDTASDELYSRMARSGCMLILYGVESGSQRILDFYNKKTNVDQIKKAIKLAKKYKMDVFASVIVGAPIENDRDVEETKNLLTGLDIDFLETNKLTIYPGTPLWNRALANGRINYDDWEKFFFVNEVFDQVSSSKIRSWGKKINTAFYARPSYLIRQIWRTFVKRVGVN
jgi:radical SAM superfamily enzyme YgiQ (UPF0313 family)